MLRVVQLITIDFKQVLKRCGVSMRTGPSLSDPLVLECKPRKPAAGRDRTLVAIWLLKIKAATAAMAGTLPSFVGGG